MCLPGWVSASSPIVAALLLVGSPPIPVTASRPRLRPTAPSVAGAVPEPGATAEPSATAAPGAEPSGDETVSGGVTPPAPGTATGAMGVATPGPPGRGAFGGGFVASGRWTVWARSLS